MPRQLGGKCKYERITSLKSVIVVPNRAFTEENSMQPSDPPSSSVEIHARLRYTHERAEAAGPLQASSVAQMWLAYESVARTVASFEMCLANPSMQRMDYWAGYHSMGCCFTQ